MNKFFSLLKVELKTLLGKSSKGKSKGKKIFLGLLIALAFVPLVGMIFLGTGEIYNIFEKINQQGMVLGVVLSLSMLIVLIFGVIYSISTFYFSTDVENLLYLPIKPSQILGSKFFIVVIYEYLTECIFLLPVLIQYGIKSSAGILYYTYSLIIFLIVPILPLVMASLIVMVVMRFTNVGKNKDRLKIIGWLLSIVLVVGINIFTQNIGGNGNGTSEMEKLFLEGNNSLAIQIVNKIFPSAKWAAEALLQNSSINGFLNILMFIGISIIGIIIFIYVAEKLYFKGVVGISETKSKRKELNEMQLQKSIKGKSKLFSYFIKEIRMLFRTPMYLINCVLMNFIWPVFFVIPIAVNKEISSNITTMGQFVSNSEIAPYVISVFFGLMMFITSSNGIASTPISREGKNFYVNKFLPISYSTMIMAKVLSAVAIEIVSTIIILVAVYFIFKIPIYMIAIFTVFSIEAMFFTSFIGVLLDLKYPKLNWDNEQKAVKQNFNVFVNLLIGAALGIGTAVLLIKLELQISSIFILIVAVYTILNALLYYIIKTKSNSIVNKIKV